MKIIKIGRSSNNDLHIVVQEHQSKKYSEFTQKRAYTYDSEKGRYPINKSNSTKIN